MELLLLNLVALFRPLMSIKYVESTFEIIGVGLFGALVAGMLVHTALTKSLRLSAIDGIIAAFTIWCVCIYVIYFEYANASDVAKLLIPLFGYMVVKNVVDDHYKYTRLLLWIIVGFSIPTIASAALIATGNPYAIETILYYSGLARWEGVYTGSHTLGHSMTLFVMTMVLYITLRRNAEGNTAQPSRQVQNILLGVLSALALYCLYMSQVRSALLGLLTFAVIYLYHYSKKLLILGAISLAVIAVLTIQQWLPALSPEYAATQKGVDVDMMDMGSGRPTRWKNDIMTFANAPIDQKIAGFGIGARGEDLSRPGERLYGHSDWLEILTQTGLVGLILFATLQILFLKAIFRMPRTERFAFLALLAAVNVMMVVSNSYVWRIQVCQLYYMILAFIEVPANRVQTEQFTVRATKLGTTAFQRPTTTV